MKKYIFLPGGLFVVVALMWAALTLRWDRGVIVLGVGGLLVLALGIAANLREIRAWFNDPRGVFAVNTVLSTLLFVAALGLINAFVAFRPVSFDWTANGRNTLTPESLTLVRSLDADVWIKQFGRTREAQANALVQAFDSAGSRVTFAFVDIEAAPAEARAYAPLRNGTVVVGSGDKFRKIDEITEPALATAILQVTSESAVTVCFASGEGERGLGDHSGEGLSELATVLGATNYQVEVVGLLQSEIPPSCRAVVVARPTVAFQPVHYERLEAYLASGGRLAVLVDPPVERGLAAWLAKYGMAPGQGLIIETSSTARTVGVGPDSPLAVVYSAHPIVQGFEMVTVFHQAVPIVPAESDYGRPAPLAGSGKDSFERLDIVSQATTPREGRDRPGPHAFGAALEMPKGAADAAGAKPRLVVFGDSDFLTNAFITFQGNKDLALRIIAWLAGEEEARTVAVSNRENRRTTLSIQGRTMLYLVTMILLPLIPLTAGLFQLYRAKRRG